MLQRTDDDDDDNEEVLSIIFTFQLNIWFVPTSFFPLRPASTSDPIAIRSNK